MLITMLQSSDERLLCVVGEMVEKGMPLDTAKEVVKSEISHKNLFSLAWRKLAASIDTPKQELNSFRTTLPNH